MLETKIRSHQCCSIPHCLLPCNKYRTDTFSLGAIFTPDESVSSLSQTPEVDSPLIRGFFDIHAAERYASGQCIDHTCGDFIDEIFQDFQLHAPLFHHPRILRSNIRKPVASKCSSALWECVICLFSAHVGVKDYSLMN